MDSALAIALLGIALEVFILILGAVWVVGKVRTESALNRQAVKSLQGTLKDVAETNKELTNAVVHLDRRVTVIEATNGNAASGIRPAQGS